MKTQKNRKHIRWRKWDYGASGRYFITICTKGRLPYFGRILPQIYKGLAPDYHLGDLYSYMEPSKAAVVADECWRQIPLHYPFVQLDTFVIMPNHLHGILFFDKPDENSWKPNQFGPQRDNLATVLGSFKAAVSRQARQLGGSFHWQTKYHDRVLRDEIEYKIRVRYMWQNPKKWREDEWYWG